MPPLPVPLQLLLLIFGGWTNRRQLAVIEYLHEENRVLKERLGRRRGSEARSVSPMPNVGDSPGKLKHWDVRC